LTGLPGAEPGADGGLLMVIIDVDPAAEDEFNRWYEEEHIPERLAYPGFRYARRFRSATVPHRYLALYDIDDAELVVSEAYMSQQSSEWSKSIQLSWLGMDRSTWEAISSRGPGAATNEE
jgi:hypothetical protein